MQGGLSVCKENCRLNLKGKVAVGQNCLSFRSRPLFNKGLSFRGTITEFLRSLYLSLSLSLKKSKQLNHGNVCGVI